MLCIAPMTEATKPGLRGEHEGNRKTIARGMPVIRLHLWRLCSCASSICTRGRGCWLKHPAFPAPSLFEGRVSKTRARLRVPRTRSRLPDAAQRFFWRCAAEPGPRKASWRIMGPGSAVRRVGKGVSAVPTIIVARCGGLASAFALQASADKSLSPPYFFKPSGVRRALFRLAPLRRAPWRPSRGFRRRQRL